eukprot:scaffold1283_cov321-Prasinococcus_capsulatus_cf.AAC.1
MLRSNGNGNGTSDAAPRGSGGQDVDAAEQQHGWTIHATEAWRSRVGDFWRAIPASRCENCGAEYVHCQCHNCERGHESAYRCAQWSCRRLLVRVGLLAELRPPLIASGRAR